VTGETHLSRSTGSAADERTNAPPLVLDAVLNRTFNARDEPVLSSFPLRVAASEILAIVGPSGCGKSTILNLIAGTDSDRNDSVLSPGTPSRAYVLQRETLPNWRSAESLCYQEVDIFDQRSDSASATVDRLLRLCRLRDAKHLFPDQMSVGMRQRAQLIRGCARHAELLLLDEPLSSVDQPLRLLIAQGLRELCKERRAAVIWVTHDVDEAITAADRVMVVGGRPLAVLATVSRADLVAPRDSMPLVSRRAADRIFDVLAGEYDRADKAGRGSSVGTPARARATTTARRPAAVRYLAPLAPIILLAVVWGIITRASPELRFFLSTPGEWLSVARREVTAPVMFGDLFVTLRETMKGLAIALPVGATVGLLAGTVPWVGAASRPYISGLTAVPLFVLAPAFILWFGVGEEMKVALAAAAGMPFVADAVFMAAAESQGAYYRYLKEAGAPRGRLIRFLTVPAAIDAVLRGLRPSTVAALLGAFLGELVAAEAGIGYRISLEAARFRVAEVLFGVTLLFVSAVLVESFARHLARNSAAVIRALRL
jgi:NitT/TauT family transport system ATP-binding protein